MDRSETTTKTQNFKERSDRTKKNKTTKGGGRGGLGGRRLERRPKEITFNADARLAYLTGFRARKRERRAYGLAMQSRKDRQAKLAKRAELRSAAKDAYSDDDDYYYSHPVLSEKDDGNSISGNIDNSEVVMVQHYHDEATQDQWGGSVVVTTSTKLISNNDDDDDSLAQQLRDNSNKKNTRTADAEQLKANSVERFLADVKGNMPSKKKKNHQGFKRKGQHGATRGHKSAGEFALARKVLKRTEKGRGRERKR